LTNSDSTDCGTVNH